MGFVVPVLAGAAGSAMSSLGGAAAVASAASTAVTGASAWYGARQQAAGARQQADYAADLAERQASLETDRLKENQRRLRANRRRYLEAARVRQANTGIRPDTGSPLAVMREITTVADEELHDFTEQALGRIHYMRDQARMTRWEGAQAAAAAPGAMSLLGVGARSWGRWDAIRNG